MVKNQNDPRQLGKYFYISHLIYQFMYHTVKVEENQKLQISGSVRTEHCVALLPINYCFMNILRRHWSWFGAAWLYSWPAFVATFREPILLGCQSCCALLLNSIVIYSYWNHVPLSLRYTQWFKFKSLPTFATTAKNSKNSLYNIGFFFIG